MFLNEKQKHQVQMLFNTQYAHKKLTVYKFLAIDILYSQKSIDFKMLLEISTRIQLR